MSRYDQPDERSEPYDRPDDEDTYREGDIMPDDLTGLTIKEAALLLGRVNYMLKPDELRTLAASLLGKPIEQERDGWREIAQDRGARLDRIAAILRRFHGTELSLSSVAPLLALAEELCPDLTDPRRI